ncbi:M20/M25/M40 family metallo-hydrolase [Planomonospora sp. ID91781]|uniref:M20/M25/M40 family metallo-hydrolase n=1 Tax=Planomonospora sp. ID91781 TaxID=2738135 RepID=UPI0018C3DF52|nr:M20/M25/M40 family metallo-hydrolase [Planomonospora sp. ID91781]
MNPRFMLGVTAALAAVALTTTSVVPASASAANAPNAAGATAPPSFAPPDPEARRRAIANAESALAAERRDLARGRDDVFSLKKAVSVSGMQFLTYSRAYQGVPVYGGDVVVATDRTGFTVAGVDTAQTAELKLDTRTTVTADRAALKARSLLTEVESVSTPALVVHALSDTPRMAWEVVVTGRAKDAPSVQHVYVDALNARILSSWDAVRAGTGHGFYNGGGLDISTSGSGSSYTMRDTTRNNLACGGQNGSPYTKSGDTWGNGQGTNLETACVDALWAAQKEWDMLRDWFGYNGFTGEGGGFPARVGLNQVNAYWNGSYTNFGKNQAGTQQATPMDVVGHEYGHAIYQFAGSGGAGSSNESGGLNESTGDIFGALLEHYANNPNDPPDYQVGEEVNLVGQGPIRYMYRPSTNGDPDCYSSSIPSTEVHAAAGPQNHWFYLLAEGTDPTGGKPATPVCSGANPRTFGGIGIQNAGRIYLAALNMKTTGNRTHAQSRSQTLSAAKALDPTCAWFEATKASWNAVNVPAVSGEPTCTPQGGNDDYSASIDPAAADVQPGQSATATISTTVTSGNAQSITLRTDSLPSGVTAAFSPAVISAGQTSRLTLTTSADTPAGSYPLTVTLDGASADKRVGFTLGVGSGQPGTDAPDISLADVKAHLQQFQSIAASNGGNRRATGPGYTASVSYVEGRLRAAGYTVTRQTCTSGCTGGAGPNLIADWPGGDPNQVVMAGAHLDGVSAGPGINDNASGSSALLEVALTLAEKNPSMAKHVRFAWWTDEEQGLNGSEFYVNAIGATERSKIKAYHNYDMVGSPNGGYFINNITTPAAAPLKEFYDKLNLRPEENTEGANRSDDAPFRNAGIPTSGVAAGASAVKTSAQATKWGGTAGRAYDPCYHASCDTAANINDTILDRAADAAAYGIWKLAVGGTGTPADDYLVSVSPSSVSIDAGGSATAVLSTTVTSGDAQSITLSATGLPSGATAVFSPPTITAGQSSTVTVTTSASTPPNTYTVSLRADGASADRSATLSLTVNGGGPGGTSWETWKSYAAGDTVTYDGVSYRCLQAHTSLPGWEPPNVPALWQRV